MVDEPSQADASDGVSAGTVDDDSSHVAQRLHGVNRVWRNDCCASWTSDPQLTSYCNLQLTIDDVPHLVVRVGMIMNPSAGFDCVVSECHIL